VLTNTAADNVEALSRVDKTPQAKAVRAVIDARPAAVGAPVVAPAAQP
jgi:hypothetical protein